MTEAAEGAEGRERVLEELRRRLVGFASSRLPRDLAEDLAQECLVLLTTKYAAVERTEDLVPLSLRILRFKMTAHWRKTRRRGEVLVGAPEDLDCRDEGPDPERRAERRQVVERLEAAFTRLESRCRELLRLKLEGLGFAQIQAALGAASINTVYTWDSRCRKKLLELMGGSWQPGELA